MTPFTETESQPDSFMKMDTPVAHSRIDEKELERRRAAEERLFQSMEVDMWDVQRQTLQFLERGGFLEDIVEKDPDKVDDYEDPKWLTQMRYEAELRRPKSASQAWSTKTSYDFMQSPVPCRCLTTKKQVKRLDRAYRDLAATKLPDAVTAVMRDNVAASEPEPVSEAQVSDALANDDQGLESDSTRSKGMARLRSLGLAPSSGDSSSQNRTREQWLRQLAEDFPDKFNRATRGNVAKPSAKWESAAERCEDSILNSRLFILNLHGDPGTEHDWELRQVWLSSNGRIWLNAPDGNTAKGSGSPTLYLGGHYVWDVQLFTVGQQEAVSMIDGFPVYALRIDFPGARFTRKKYFAAFDVETRDDWLRICSSLTPAKDV